MLQEASHPGVRAVYKPTQQQKDFVTFTFPQDEQQLSLLQLQREAELAPTRRAEQRPRIPQGFELQREALPGGRPRPGTQLEEEAAVAIEAHHVRVWNTTRTHNKLHMSPDICVQSFFTTTETRPAQ